MARSDREVIIIRPGHSTESSSGSGWGFVIGLFLFFAIAQNLGRSSSEHQRKLAPPPAECSDAACVAAYGQFLSSASPRAFAISDNGAWSWTANEPDDDSATGKALTHCAQAGGIGCRVVVNGSDRYDQDAQRVVTRRQVMQAPIQ